MTITLLDLFKNLTDKEKETFIRLIIKEINNVQEKDGKVLLIS